MKWAETSASPFDDDLQLKFLDDLQADLDRGEFISVLTKLDRAVRIDYGHGGTDKLTIYDHPIDHPVILLRPLENIRKQAFAGLITNQLGKVLTYIHDYPETPESKYLSEQLGKLNKDSTLSEILTVMLNVQRCFKSEKKPWYLKNQIFFANETHQQHQIANQNQIQDVIKEISTLQKLLDDHVNYLNVYSYAPDAKGTINTATFRNWQGNPRHPGDLYCSALLRPGCSIKDILRDTKLGSESCVDLLIRVVENNASLRTEADKQRGYVTIREWLRENTEFLSKVQALARKTDLIGTDPIVDKLLFLEIMRTIDAGLNNPDGCEQLYQAYANAYDELSKLLQQNTHPDITLVISRLISHAKDVLTVHNRDFLALEEKQKMYYYSNITIRDSTKEIKFDPTDTARLVKYLENSKIELLKDDNFEMAMLVKIEMLLNYLKKSGNNIFDSISHLKNFAQIVKSTEKMPDAVDNVDSLIINPLIEIQKQWQNDLTLLAKQNIDATPFTAAFEKLVQERFNQDTINPKCAKMKAEILSVGQTVFVNFQESQLQSTFVIEHKYKICSMAELVNGNPRNAETCKLYISDQGYYCVRHPNGEVHVDKTPQTLVVNPRNFKAMLSNEDFKTKLLAETTKRNHTLERIPLELAGGGRREITFAFDGQGEAGISVNYLQNKFNSQEGMVGFDGEGQKVNLTDHDRENFIPKPDALSTQLTIHLSHSASRFQPVNATLTQLNYVSTCEQLIHVGKQEEKVKTTEIKQDLVEKDSEQPRF